jgi:cytochrome c biogenesis protein CcdA
VLAQATGLALLAALSPTALLVVAVYLGSASPKRTAAYYLAGALAMTTVIAVIALVVLRSAGLSHPDHQSARDGLRLGLGLLLALAGLLVAARRRRRRPDPGRQGHGIVSRLVASPTPGSASPSASWSSLRA